MRMQKVDYKSQKIPVSVTFREKDEIEKEAKTLGISAPALLRLLFKLYQKSGKKLTVDTI